MALWGKKEEPKKVEAPKGAAPPAPAAKASNVVPLSPEEAKKRAGASAQLLLKFGEIVGVLMRTPQYRALPLSEVEALVVPAVMTGQFLVAEAQSKTSGFVTPVAAALWASVSKEVDQRLSKDLDKPVQLKANEWKSGDIPWLICLAGDGRIISQMVKGLEEKVLKGKPLKMRIRDKNGKNIVGNFAAAVEAAAAAQKKAS